MTSFANRPGIDCSTNEWWTTSACQERERRKSVQFCVEMTTSKNGKKKHREMAKQNMKLSMENNMGICAECEKILLRSMARRCRISDQAGELNSDELSVETSQTGISSKKQIF